MIVSEDVVYLPSRKMHIIRNFLGRFSHRSQFKNAPKFAAYAGQFRRGDRFLPQDVLMHWVAIIVRRLDVHEFVIYEVLHGVLVGHRDPLQSRFPDVRRVP